MLHLELGPKSLVGSLGLNRFCLHHGTDFGACQKLLAVKPVNLDSLVQHTLDLCLPFPRRSCNFTCKTVWFSCGAAAIRL